MPRVIIGTTPLGSLISSNRGSGAALLAELLLFGAMTASAAGHAAAALLVALPGLPAASRQITLDDASMAVAVCLIGAAWWGVRQGRALSTSLVTRSVAAGITLLV